ncbi:MAG: hypothetical protein CVU18_13750 [Betaproteobacteria bacterium HGW-Betaproteobacteria-12]|nr:MAG: hypothetical protein CVU18_13750 [Betaproteobacteria bacterium HGW-Betaproteobacteria-12]
MKSTKLFATVALTGLLAIAGGATADSAHDAYNNAFFGDSGGRVSGTVGKAAYGTPAGQAMGVDGHAAYRQAFYGDSGMTPPTAIVGKAAFGSGSSTADAHAAYANAFHGD